MIVKNKNVLTKKQEMLHILTIAGRKKMNRLK